MIQRKYKGLSPWVVVGVEGRDYAAKAGITTIDKPKKENLLEIEMSQTFRWFARWRGTGIPPSKIAETVLDKVLGLLCMRYGIALEHIHNPSRKAEIVYVRQLYCYLLSEIYNNAIERKYQTTLLHIAAQAGYGIDHSQVIYNVKVFSRTLEQNAPLPRNCRYKGTVKEDYDKSLEMLIRSLNNYKAK